MPRKLINILVIVLGVALLAVAFYQLPPVKSRLSWRIEQLRADIKYAIDPPEKKVFVPQGQVATPVNAITPILSSPTPSPLPATATPTPEISPTPTQTSLPTLTPTSIPARVMLEGIVYEPQHWNNCGPANLSMTLSYWKWQGTQDDTAAYLKPNARDKNVMPYEMVNYVMENTSFQAVARSGGTLALIKQFLAAGYPVLIEKGFEGDSFDGWMGHYGVVTGYDETNGYFVIQDSYIKPNLQVPFDQVERNWRAFNFIFLVVYPVEDELEVRQILGPLADETAAWQAAAQRAAEETIALSGRDQYFAWYNRGTSLVNLLDYAGAAASYDQAFGVYASIPEKSRPWRMLWYQTGPYFAYYFTGRYQEVIDLATATLGAMSEPAIEESYVWRSRAKAAMGDIDGAVEDLHTALKWHPGFGAAVADLQQLGAQP